MRIIINISAHLSEWVDIMIAWKARLTQVPLRSSMSSGRCLSSEMASVHDSRDEELGVDQIGSWY